MKAEKKLGGAGSNGDAGDGAWPAEAPDAIRANIRRVIAIEEASALRRSHAERATDIIGGFVGTFLFVAIHLCVIAAWLAVNLGATGLHPFDAPPFNLLATIASLESVILTALVLMKQRRMSRLSDRRDHLDLQVNLLTEREVSLLIEMVGQLGERLGVPVATDEALGLSRASATEHLVEELHRHMPDSGPSPGG